jgi:hypothetical protein
MPSFFGPTRNYAAGADIGGQDRLSINNQLVSVGLVQSARTLDTDRVMFGNDIGLFTYDRGTQVVTPVPDTGPTTWLRAGFGHWGSRLQSSPAQWSDSFGRRRVTGVPWRPIACGPLGVLVSGMFPDRQRGLWLVTADPTPMTLMAENQPTFDTEGDADIDGWAMRIDLNTIALAKWTDGPLWRAIAPGFPSRNVAVAGRYLVVERQGAAPGLYVIDTQALTGAYVPGADAQVIALDAQVDGDTLFLVASNTQGCAPGTMWTVNVPLASLAWAPLTAEPPPVEVPTPAPPSATFNDPVWVAPYFSQSVRYGRRTQPDYVGNAVLVLPHESYTPAQNREFLVDPQTNLGMPVICTPDNYDDDIASQIIALYTDASTPETLAGRVAAIAREFYQPIVAYLDMPTWPEHTGLDPSRVWPAVQAYRDLNEPLADFDNRVYTVLYKLIEQGFTPWVVPQAYTRNGQVPVQHALDSLSVVQSWFNELPLGGMLDHPEIRAAVKAWMPLIPHERPNRHNFWDGINTGVQVRNILSQSRRSVVLTPRQKAFILERL